MDILNTLLLFATAPNDAAYEITKEGLSPFSRILYEQLSLYGFRFDVRIIAENIQGVVGKLEEPLYDTICSNISNLNRDDADRNACLGEASMLNW